ncbi:MAG TPA: hypothetical protein VNF47_26160 [Streptosporangiaceae bacterium]|nr:hypothetical protein [Streptosporangiaceae bacterium]
MSKAALRYKLRPDGPWKVVLPGIYLSHNGLLTVGQREMAAVLYSGRGSVITGPAALVRQGVRLPISEIVDVLIPATVKRQSASFVRVHRTCRIPEEVVRIDGLRWAPVARAVADSARDQAELRAVRALVAAVVQQGKCTVSQLATELRSGPSQGSAALRAAIQEVTAGVHSVAEADLRKLIMSNGLPDPMYNPTLYTGATFLARPDAWWPEAGVACEVDSREWHISPVQWDRTLARHARMSAHGIIVLHLTPRRIRSESRAVVAEIKSALENGRKRPQLPIHAVPHR